MTTTAMLKMKQQLSRLSVKERREVAAYLHRLKQESPEWKREMARRMHEMDGGRKVRLPGVSRRARHANA